VPVIGAASGAIPEVVSGIGEVFPEGDAPALAACIRRLLHNPHRRAEQAGKGRDRAVERYSWNRIAERYRAVYSDALAGSIQPALLPVLPLPDPAVPEPQD